MRLSVRICALVAACLYAAPVQAEPSEGYYAGIALAAQGQDKQAVQYLRQQMALVPLDDPWRQRIQAAAGLIEARGERKGSVNLEATPIQQSLAASYIRVKPAPGGEPSIWPVGLMSLMLPAAGHAWMGRWRDAAVAAGMVWPMIGLTLWAARRRMGPVTVFFAVIAVWLWSGVIFSSLSLAEREAGLAYVQWWQGLWSATGLPGRPW